MNAKEEQRRYDRNEAGNADVQAENASVHPDDMTVESLAEQLLEMRDRWMRSQAEMANVRTRAKRDVDDARSYAVQKFANDVVEAAENLHRGLEKLPKASDLEPESMTGLRLGLVEIERGFVGLLERNGVKKEDPVGLAFDPNFHQAMAEKETDEYPPGTVLNTLGPLWTLNGRLLRPAMVVVSKSPPSGR